MRITRVPSSLSFGLVKTSLRWQNLFHMVLFLNQFKSQVCQNKTLVVSVIIYLEQPVSKFTFVGCCQGISHWCLSPLPNSEGSIASQEGFRQKKWFFQHLDPRLFNNRLTRSHIWKMWNKKLQKFLCSLFTSFRKGGFKSWGSYNAF